jgi:hypothetical protein
MESGFKLMTFAFDTILNNYLSQKFRPIEKRLIELFNKYSNMFCV